MLSCAICRPSNSYAHLGAKQKGSSGSPCDWGSVIPTTPSVAMGSFCCAAQADLEFLGTLFQSSKCVEQHVWATTLGQVGATPFGQTVS